MTKLLSIFTQTNPGFASRQCQTSHIYNEDISLADPTHMAINSAPILLTAPNRTLLIFPRIPFEEWRLPLGPLGVSEDFRLLPEKV